MNKFTSIINWLHFRMSIIAVLMTFGSIYYTVPFITTLSITWTSLLTVDLLFAEYKIGGKNK